MKSSSSSNSRTRAKSYFQINKQDFVFKLQGTYDQTHILNLQQFSPFYQANRASPKWGIRAWPLLPLRKLLRNICEWRGKAFRKRTNNSNLNIRVAGWGLLLLLIRVKTKHTGTNKPVEPYLEDELDLLQAKQSLKVQRLSRHPQKLVLDSELRNHQTIWKRSPFQADCRDK